MAITRSFEKINYSVRPAKAAERHMLVEAIGRLAPFAPLSHYLYAGFGSTFFVDFRLLHQRYGLTRLYSIEHDVENEQRFTFNVPYDCVTMLFGPARERLIDVPWHEAPAVVWLDYDYPLSTAVLADIDRVLERVRSGSMLLLTVDADPGEVIQGRAQRLDKELEEHAPQARDEQLSGWRIAEHYFRVLGEYVPDALQTARGDDLRFEQLFAFRYKDGHRMATYGGVLYSPDDQELLDACRFDELPYVVPAGTESFEVAIPNLTPREQAEIERFMPSEVDRARERLDELGVPVTDVADYADVYRYAPRFVETFA